MTYNSFPKGSIWRKWDLHVHTPFSVLNNGFGNDWDEYVENLFKKAIENNIAAIGITDYFSIDGYARLRLDYLDNPSKLNSIFDVDEIEKIKNIFVFPNIEFRIDKLITNTGLNDNLNRKVNYHLLVSNKLKIEDIQENLLHCIEFETLDVLGQGPQKRTLSRRNLEDFGAELKKQHRPFNKYSDVFVGMMNASVNVGQIQEVLKNHSSIFQGNYLFAIPSDEDLSSISWNDGGHAARKVLIQKANVIFSANPKTVKFGLGKSHESEESYIAEFSSLKPCFWGSDAHDYERLFLPDEGRNTWIKADLTFEGLKGVVYEPEGRVRIQENEPESKPLYQVIDKVRFNDRSNKEVFSNDLIEFNENLNTIIGGKSSGKSLLLYHIAKAIAPSQVSEKTQDSVSDYSSFLSEKPFDLEVFWKDKTINTLDESEEKNGQITFIPQLYINHLAEEGGKNSLFNLIENILDQNESFLEYKKYFNTEKQNAKETIHRCIQELLRLTNTFQLKQKEIQEIGTKEQLLGEKGRLQKQVELLTKQSGLTEDQAIKYHALEDEKRKYEAALKRAISRVKNYEEINTSFEDIRSKFISDINQKVDEHLIPDDRDYQSILNEGKEFLLNDVHSSFNRFFGMINQQVDTIKNNIEDGEKKLENIRKELQPFVQIAKNREILKTEQKKLTDIESKLTLLKTKQEELLKVKDQGIKNNERLFSAYNSLFTCYQNLVVEIQKPEYSRIDTELLLKSKLVFNGENFSSSFSGLFDRRGNFHQIFNQTFDVENQFVFSPQQHVGNIKTIFDKIRSSIPIPLRLRVGMNEDEKFQRLFDDYFKIEYTIEHKGDDMLNMSPGKRGIVLLQLILHISTATHPILIDQPEDNLDNRTIFYDLKDFIIQKKRNRQIIIVTHNANLVVSTDAECVIVANQGGQQAGKDNKRYKFEFVTGALENTFLNEKKQGVLYQKGIKEHVCDILEGGKEAFLKREQKYGFTHLK